MARTSIIALLLGIAIVIGVSTFVGPVLDINPFIPEISVQRVVRLGDIVLAVASGIAAALLITLRASTSLVGVAVAVSLLPPLVTFGLLLGEGRVDLSFGPLLLFISSVIAINLSGVFTFYAMGIRPSSWWEADKARRSTAIAMTIWGVLLVVLLVIVLIVQHIEP